MKRWILILVALALVVPVAWGTVLAQGGQARVRAVHASPGGPAVDVLINGSTAASNVNYTDVTPYGTVNAGATNIQVVPTDNPQSPLLTIDTDLKANTDYTVAVVGQPDSVEPLVLVDDNTPPPPGQARVRFVHASPNAPAVDVAQQGGAVLFSNVSFKEAAGYILLAGGTFNLEVREAGTNNVVLSVPNVALQSCNVYTIWAMGLVNDQPPLEAVTSTDATTSCATPAPGATVPPGGTAGAAKAITQAATVVTGTPRATGSPSASGTATTGTPTKTTGTPTKATGTPGTKTATKQVTKVITIPKVTIQLTKAPTKPGAVTIAPQIGTPLPVQPTAPLIQTPG
jgi:hypothetical protein